MNREELIAKMLREEPLTAAENEALDALLASEGQREIAELVALQPDDVPSLAWRSNLNQRIGALEAKPARRNWFTWGVPVFAAAAAVAVTLFVMPKAPTPMSVTTETSSLEASLVNAHMEALLASDAGLATAEAEPLADEILEWTQPVFERE